MLEAMSRPGSLIRERRLAHGLTQAQLALRAGTTQAAVSRLERGELSPSFATVENLLFVMGDGLELAPAPLPIEQDAAHLADLRARPPAERLELAIGWNRLAGEVARAGAHARRGS